MNNEIPFIHKQHIQEVYELKKLLGQKRREKILSLLKNSQGPITGTDLAKVCNVSRQVIVNDINLLKALNEPIIATYQGYIYLVKDNEFQSYEKKIACCHTKEEAEDELYTIVDCGVTVKNVIVEHPIYGEITANMMLSNRLDVANFIEQVNNTNASFLSQLTGGPHLHVLTARSMDQLNQAEQLLRQKGYLVED